MVMSGKFIFSLTFWILPQILFSQHLQLLHTNNAGLSIRGLCVVDDSTIWVSGTNGTIGKSTDGGLHWTWMQVPGFEKTDFRDIEAVDAKTAIIMGVAEPAFILKTKNGGTSWTVVFEDRRKGMFLDAMAFRDERNGIVIGDPAGGRFFIARTADAGDSWQPLPEEDCPEAHSGEALFAASGTNILPLSPNKDGFVTGGTTSRIFLSNKVVLLPLLQGKSSTGANAVAVYQNPEIKQTKQLVVVGGDFAADTLGHGNCAVSFDGGLTWQLPAKPPTGYRSSVVFLSEKKLVTCGTTGVDISEDGGMNWNPISRESFHVCGKSKNGNLVILAGKNGRIAKLVW